MTQNVEQSGPKIAIVGAGISGLACARKLYDEGLPVTVYEKSRGLGGRMATRRTETDITFDHGAQYFTVKDPEFETHVSDWLQEGVVAIWDTRIGTLTNGTIEYQNDSRARYVGVPGMNAICHYLAAGVDIRFNALLEAPTREHNLWQLCDEQGERLGLYDIVLITAPAPQTAQLLSAIPDMQHQVQVVPMNGCWAAMISFEKSLGLEYGGAFVEHSLLSWIACNSSKPGRGPAFESWVLHASQAWSSEHIEDKQADVLYAMLEAFWQATGANAQSPRYANSHRWRYAIPPEPLEPKSLYDPELKIGACGDWCSGPRVEGAYLSGLHLAEQILS